MQYAIELYYDKNGKATFDLSKKSLMKKLVRST